MKLPALGLLLVSSAAVAAPKGDDAAMLAAINKNNAKAAAALVAAFPLLTSHVWFDDASCREKFDSNAAPAISEEDFPAWVKCMSKLGLRQGQAAANGTAWWTFDPGIALGVSLNGTKVTAIVGRTTDGAPWVGRKAATQHLRAGTLKVVNDGGVVGGEAGGGREGDYASAEVCITPEGSIDSYTPDDASDPDYAQQIRTAAKSWRFKPFLRKGKAIRVCANIEATAPDDKTPPVDFLLPPVRTLPPPPPPPGTDRIPNNVPPALLENYRTGGEKAIVPDDDTKTEIARHGGKVVGSYKLCLDSAGTISKVQQLKATGYPAYDAKLMSTIKNTWTYSPYLVDGKAIPVCTAVTFIYSQK